MTIKIRKILGCTLLASVAGAVNAAPKPTVTTVDVAKLRLVAERSKTLSHEEKEQLNYSRRHYSQRPSLLPRSLHTLPILTAN